ncbi:hypothetical protein E2C01_042262 [Portunus trituberculatus]|uniref:Uncharacterized protein n=1 Tax=Portunus trituberculatus TaxID=210409 RepID=A0A5B7FT72_PORTR|nr:hypothetical protein [Portunus trituberculatus]
MPTVPPWNVDIVLCHLVGTPLQPLDQSSLWLLTQKTPFLLALATAKRVGEIRALSTLVVVQDHDMVLFYLAEFVVKTEIPSDPLPREFVLTSLSEAVCSNDDEWPLCPVRALRWYLHRAQSPSRPRYLFLSVRDPTHPLSKTAISYFLQQLIRAAHQDFSII